MSNGNLELTSVFFLLCATHLEWVRLLYISFQLCSSRFSASLITLYSYYDIFVCSFISVTLLFLSLALLLVISLSFSSVFFSLVLFFLFCIFFLVFCALSLFLCEMDNVTLSTFLTIVLVACAWCLFSI